MKLTGFYLSVHFVLYLVIICIAMAAVGGGSYYAYNNVRNENIRAQAQAIDKSLISYAQRHKGINRNKLKKSIVNDNYGPVYEQQLDFPVKLTNKGAIYNNRGNMTSGEDFGFVDRKIQFFEGNETSFQANPEEHLYQFLYVPLDENGNELSSTDTEPVACYKLLVYIKTFQGGVVLYESPGSYNNLPAKFIR